MYSLAAMRRWGLALATVVLLVVAPTTALGRRWTLLTVPPVPGQRDGSLTAVSCANPTACIAVGNYTDRNGRSRNLAERWGKARFSLQEPAGVQKPAFLSVSCPIALTCTGVGSQEASWAQRFRRGEWRIQGIPRLRGRLHPLYGVSCASRRMCMAVGFVAYKNNNADPSAALWNGQRWAVRKLPMPRGVHDGELNSVSCATTRACVAVGEYNPGWDARPLTEVWNGRRWRFAPAPGPRGQNNLEVLGVSCASASWCEAAGVFMRGVLGDSFGLLEHWDGRHWKVQHAPGPPGRANQTILNAISCPARGSCTAVGSSSLGTRGFVLAERLRGAKWSLQSTPNPRFGGGLNGVSCTRREFCLAVGDEQTGADPYSAARQIALRFS